MRARQTSDHDAAGGDASAAAPAPGKATRTQGLVVQRKPADGAAAATTPAASPGGKAPAATDDPYGMHLAGAHEHAHGAPDVDGAAPAADPKDGKEGKDGKAPVVKEEISGELGFKIMKDAFSGLKADLSMGKVEVLDEAAFKVAYDKIYGATQYSWEKYVVPKWGGLRGFAHEGTNYVNKDGRGLDIGTVVHEMLHNNVAADFSGVVGHQFEEGATEYLTVIAMKKAGKPRASAYADQLACVTGCVTNGLSEANLQSAYLVSGAQRLIADWFTGAMEGPFTDFKADMEAEDYAKAKAKIKKKAAGAAK